MLETAKKSLQMLLLSVEHNREKKPQVGPKSVRNVRPGYASIAVINTR